MLNIFKSLSKLPLTIGLKDLLIKNSQDRFFHISLIFLISSIALDQITKSIIYNTLPHFQQIEILPFFNLVNVKNYGVSFGMFNNLSNGRLLLSVIVTIITVVLFYIYLKASKRDKYGFALIIAGAIGNTIDRVSLGFVIDFLDFHIAGYHWPAFNVADISIFCGVSLIIFLELFIKKDSKNSKV